MLMVSLWNLLHMKCTKMGLNIEHILHYIEYRACWSYFYRIPSDTYHKFQYLNIWHSYQYNLNTYLRSKIDALDIKYNYFHSWFEDICYFLDQINTLAYKRGIEMELLQYMWHMEIGNSWHKYLGSSLTGHNLGHIQYSFRGYHKFYS